MYVRFDKPILCHLELYFIVKKLELIFDDIWSSSEYFGLFLSVVIPPVLHIHSSIIGNLQNKPISGCSIKRVALTLLLLLIWIILDALIKFKGNGYII
jgi:hypothetical protein